MKENLLIIRRLLLTLALVCVGYTLQAQDLIVKKSGEVLSVYNIDIADRWVYYAIDASTDGDLKRISKEEVFSVKIGSGEMQMIGTAQAAQPAAPKAEEPQNEVATAAPKIVERKTADNNAAMITHFNRTEITGIRKKEPNDKKVQCGYAVVKAERESVLSNEDIEVSMEMIRDEQFWEWVVGYRIHLKNKTNRMIYVDLANTFRIMNNGASKVYYDGSQVTETKGGSTGGAVNLGAIAGEIGVGGAIGTIASGINVGGARNNSTSKSFGTQRILAIPPMGKVELPPHYRADRKKVVEEYDSFRFDLPEGTFTLHCRHIYNFEEETSPWKNHFVVTYSHEADFKTYANLKFSFYAAQLVGTNVGEFANYALLVERLMGYEPGSLISHVQVKKEIDEVKDVKNTFYEGSRWCRNYY